ncbi:dyslexia-associated protein KIAA0319 [Engraulis encrasicolus]|uniref:dyslexia-associated protein KIAA0319 n=1 Tax=Engraulis encrasicolus TaxID=184585 RepID=UPI002FD64470
MTPGHLLVTCLALHLMKGVLATQCWQGATFSESIVSPDLKSSSILRVPKVTSLAQCAGACCDLPGCDLAWLLERRCYVLSCQRKDNCAPKQRRGADSYLAFLQRGPPQTLVLQSLVRGREPFPPGRWPQVPAHHRGLQASLKDLALLQGGAGGGAGGGGERDFDGQELEYADLYRGPEEQEEEEEEVGGEEEGEEEEEDVGEGGLGTESLKEGLVGLLDWPDVQGSREALNLTESEDGRERQQAALMESNGGGGGGEGGGGGVGARAGEGEGGGGRAKSGPTALSQDFSADLVQLSRISQTRTPAPDARLLAASTMATAHTPPVETVRSLQVSIEGPVDVTLPVSDVELTASVTVAAETEKAADPSQSVEGSSYSYSWAWLSRPEDQQGAMEGQSSRTLKITGLTAGLYALKVTVSGERSHGEAAVNITVHSDSVNSAPKAVVNPPTQELTFPVGLVVINGSESADEDADIVNYRWEQVGGPPLANASTADSPVLLLHILEPGTYSFRLTVTDSRGLADSATASVIVANRRRDLPPVADAGPDAVVTLPVDHLVVRGNRSTDDQAITAYLWTLDPSSHNTAPNMEGLREPFLQLSGLQEGQYTFLLTVTDSSGQQDSSPVTVTVLPVNAAPVAVVGPDRQLILPVNSVTLDGSSSTDDRGIASFQWDTVSGPPGTKIEDASRAVTTATGLRAGNHKFLLTVKDQQGALDKAAFTVTVKEARSLPLVAHASGSHTLTLPNNSLVLRGSVSNAGPTNVSFVWVRDEQSPAAGDILYSSERSCCLYLANLVEGTYLFQLRVSDGLGRSSSATATVEVRPDPREREEVELELAVGVAQVSQQQKSTVLRQLAALLHVLDADIALKGLHDQSDISTVMRFSVQGSDGTIPGPRLAKLLRNQLLKQKTDFLLFKVLRVDTVMCLLRCSGRGQCDPVSKSCACDPLWMENPFQRLLEDGESNCEWNVLYVMVSGFLGLVLVLSVSWTCLCCCKRTRRTKVRKKTKYTILDNMDEQERMELRPKYHIKHRSTEHNSSLMMSESEFESEQDTIFSHDRSDRPRNRSNGAVRNGDAFSFRSVDS